MLGTLYLVATPIGNLKDITLRALEVLREVDFIAAEDTRHTQKLLNHFEIRKKLLSFHEYSDQGRAQEIIGALREGRDVALVSDAGTPLISDPGYILVKQCADAGLDVQSIPGACAAVAAVTLSGMDCGNFAFAGFLPTKSAARKKELERLANTKMPFILYESPNRVTKTLADICTVLGEGAPVCMARELTKLHEEVIRATAREVLALLEGRESVKGEFVLVVGAGEEKQAGEDEITALLLTYLERGMTKKEAVTFVTAELQCPKNKVYQLLIGLTGK